MSDARKERRVCIVGTAPTWKEAPWDDPSMEFWCLNDFHLLKPKRADRWYDLHPFDHMYFHSGGKKILSHQVPPGYFIRPQGHLEFLKAQSIPVYVQDASLLGTPNARTFPKADVEAAVGPYFASSPAWMVGHALAEGVTELHIYGIHLATEWEYLKQKPNMAFLLGMAAGRGVKIVIPKTAPLLRESHQYAYQVDPDLPKVAIKRRMDGLQMELRAVEQKMAVRRWWQRVDPNWATRKAWLQAQLMDCQLELQSVAANRSPIGA
jgi:hypothetical protein